jgi:hypothetical protein
MVVTKAGAVQTADENKFETFANFVSKGRIFALNFTQPQPLPFDD